MFVWKLPVSTVNKVNRKMTEILDDMQENGENLEIGQQTNVKSSLDEEVVSERDIEVQASNETTPNDPTADDSNDNLQKDEEKLIDEAFKIIDGVSEEMKEAAVRIARFGGPRTHTEYLYLDEILIRATVKLDNLETNGIDIIRQNRKKMIQYIQYLQNELDKRVTSDSSNSSNSSV